MLISKLLFKLYGYKRRSVRRLILRLIKSIEGGEFYSMTLRKIFKHYHHVDIGLYTHGGCFVPKRIHAHTTIGRYCSIADGVKVFNRNHPVDAKSTHAFFFNPNLGYCKQDRLSYKPLKIGHDVWLGDGVKILPEVTEIGTGAVVGAGSILHKNIPPYSIVVGHPARVVRYRFSKAKIEALLKSRWWDKSIEEILPDIDEYQHSLEK